jgi:hypothetical protein
MGGKTRGSWAGLVVLAALLGPAGARAEGPFGWWPWKKNACPRSSYSPCHYWTPEYYRVDAFWHPLGNYMHAVDRHPEVPPDYRINQYPCPAVDPTVVMSGSGYASLFTGGQQPARPQELKSER